MIFKPFSCFLQSKFGLLAVFIGLVGINLFLFVWSNKNDFPKIQSRKGASGFCLSDASKFAYFHYYTGYFPLASLNKNLIYSKESAIKEIEENGKNLVMEHKHWYRLGENARIFALLPSCYLNKSPEFVSLRPFKALLFTTTLLVLFWGFWQIGYALPGLLLVVCINFTPFFLYEIYTHENIFSLMACSFFLVLGTNMYSLFSSSYNKYLLLFSGFVSAIILGFLTEIRNEVSIVILSLLLIIAFAKKISLIRKLIYITIVFVTFLGTKQGIRIYFKSQFEKTKMLVQEKGGHVYEGKTLSSHLFWHPFFCGLGDFDKKYGYKWSDRYAYNYAVPILKKKYGISLKYSGGFKANEYYDADQLYYVKIEEIPQYNEVIRDKVLGDIKADPLWYLEIICKRILQSLTKTIPFPYFGWFIFPLIGLLIRTKNWTYLKLLVTSLPTMLISILIYSNSGSTYNSVFVYIMIAIIFMLFKDGELTYEKLKLQLPKTLR